VGENLDFPFHLAPSGRSAATDGDDRVRDMIEQLLFTEPGERVNRPTFGCGLSRLVFEPVGPERAAATRFLVQGQLDEVLGALIDVRSVTVDVVESRLTVQVDYARRDDGRRREDRFFVAVGGEP
jgi:phage baseplate assembly protein W